MALASAGEIDYRGIITSSSVPPYNRHMTLESLSRQLEARKRIIAIGRESGLRNVPDPIEGSRGNLVKPSSGRIEDTEPLDTPGSHLIIQEAHKASNEQPLVVISGGPMTTVANAVLQDESIADRIIVAVDDNRAEGLFVYNGWADGWAAYIVLEKLRLVVFPIFPHKQYPRLSKDWIRDNLPDSEAKNFMLSLSLDVVNDEDGDSDGMQAIALMRADYVRSAKRVSFGGWRTRDGHEMPIFQDDPKGLALVVIKANANIAAREYQRALRNYNVWHQKAD